MCLAKTKTNGNSRPLSRDSNCMIWPCILRLNLLPSTGSCSVDRHHWIRVSHLDWFASTLCRNWLCGRHRDSGSQHGGMGDGVKIQNLDLSDPGGGDSSVVRAPDSWLKGRGFESLLERRENFLLQGRLSVLTLISVSVPPPCYHSST